MTAPAPRGRVQGFHVGKGRYSWRQSIHPSAYLNHQRGERLRALDALVAYVENINVCIINKMYVLCFIWNN